jgi:hypothetical protein
MKTRISIIISIIFCLSAINQNASSQTVVPKENNGICSLSFANVYVEIDAKYSARITSLKINEKELVFVDRTKGTNIFGCSFWPSPQSVWNWPPPRELNNMPYSGGIVDNKVVLRSSEDKRNGLILKRSLMADNKDTSITITYTIINTKTTAASWAAWELFRVPAGGLHFFPTGVKNDSGPMAAYFTRKSNITWYQHASGQEAEKKMFGDGSKGWLAYVSNSNAVLIKKFVDLQPSQQAPKEMEIEYWLNNSPAFIEIENQGPYTTIQPGDSSEWVMKWFVRELPSSAKAEIGDEALINFVKKVAKDK